MLGNMNDVINMLRIILLFAVIQTILTQNTQSDHSPYRLFIFTHQCYDTLFNQGHIFDFPCLKKSIVKLLGYGVVVGAAIVKVPQIVRIIQEKSTVGVSFWSVILELFSNLCAVAYHVSRGNPFSVYGETFLIALQMVVIHLLFIVYSPPKDPLKTVHLVFLLPAGVVFWAALHPVYFPSYIIENSLLVQMLIFLGAKLLQIYEIHRLRSTGSLALITVGLSFLGNVARIATAVVEVADDLLFGISVIQAFLLNGYILLTFFIFGSKKQQSKGHSQKNTKTA